jgi:WD40 repeat protein
MPETRARGGSSDVFISYSRRDSAFVRRLYDGLKENGRSAWVDWEGIPPSAKWMDTLRSAIESCDALVFVITPASVASEVCAAELEHAASHNKRIVPVVASAVEADEVPRVATERNWIFFDGGRDFDEALRVLLRTLDTDPEWTRLHTRLLVRAVEWDSGGREDSFALRGRDLESAEAWLTSNDARKDPQPTPLHTEYIVASRAATTRTQRRRTAALSIGLVVALALAGLAFIQFRRAEDEAQVATSRELASSSLLQGATNPELGLALAVEAGRVDSTEEADVALRQGIEDTYVLRIMDSGGTSLTAMDVSPDGEQLVAGGNGELFVFDATSGESVATFDAPAREVDGVAVSPDGERFAVAGGKAAVILDAKDGTPIESLPGGPGKEWWVTWHPSGKELATAGADGTVRTWTESGKELSSNSMHEGEAVFSVDYDPSGRMLVSGGRDGHVRVWEPRSGRQEHAFAIDSDIVRGDTAIDVNAVAFSPDGKSVAAGVDDGNAFVWGLRGRPPMLLPSGEQPVYGITYRQDGTRVAVAALDGSTRVFDVSKGGRKGVRVSNLAGHSGGVNAVAYLDGGELLATASGDGSARIWRPEPSDARATFSEHRGSVLGATFAPDGESVATAGLDGTVRIWRPGGEALATLKPEGHGLSDLWSPAFDPKGERIAAGMGNGTAQVWNIESGAVVSRFEGHDQRVVGVEFSPDGEEVVTSALERRDPVRVWGAASGAESASFDGHGDWVFDVAWAPDGERVVSAGADGTARVWDPATGDEQLALEGHRDFVRTAAFNPDGSLIVTGGEDRTARIWDVESGTPTQILRGHTDAVLSATFSPDGELVATAGPDRTVRIWRVGDGKLLDVLKGHDDWISQVAFAPDGSEVVTASYDDTAAIMRCELCIGFGDLLELAESRATYELSPEEREQYLHE